jgi:hypothetical protein
MEFRRCSLVQKPAGMMLHLFLSGAGMRSGGCDGPNGMRFLLGLALGPRGRPEINARCSIPTAWCQQSFIKEQRMRKLTKPTEQEISEGPQSVSFEIANGNMRQRCILQTELPTKAEAQKYLLSNWSIVERMARNALAAGTIEDGEIKLVMT